MQVVNLDEINAWEHPVDESREGVPIELVVHATHAVGTMAVDIFPDLDVVGRTGDDVNKGGFVDGNVGACVCSLFNQNGFLQSYLRVIY